MKRHNQTIKNFGETIGKKPQRSIFIKPHKHLTTMNAGDLIPIFWDEIYPGDRVKIDMKSVIRQSTLMKPVMDEAFIDAVAMFVPNRIIMDDWKKFLGENDDEWAPKAPITLPTTKAPKGGWETGTLADYLGIPTKIDNIEVNSILPRALAKVYNEWFRDQNWMKAAHINYGNETTEGSNGKNYITDIEKLGMPPKAAKTHDYFTSLLPAPQKGEAVTINIGGQAPVHAKKDTYDTARDESIRFDAQLGSARALGMDAYGKIIPVKDQPIELQNVRISPNNLYADLADATGININTLREHITAQQILELKGLGGTRYTEILKTFWNVNSGDARLQRPEYLGGIREPLNIQQVPSTTSIRDEKNPQALADLGAFGWSNADGHQIINKGFVEHGTIIILATIRYQHTYQQGLNRFFSRKDELDFYNPLLANIGEQPVYNQEIYAQGNAQDQEVLGYQEPWAELRFKPNIVTGQFRSNAKDGTLDVWHYADTYKSLPKMGTDFILETQEYIDRTLVYKSIENKNTPQFLSDFYFKIEHERALPTFSIPGLKKI